MRGQPRERRGDAPAARGRRRRRCGSATAGSTSVVRTTTLTVLDRAPDRLDEAAAEYRLGWPPGGGAEIGLVVERAPSSRIAPAPVADASARRSRRRRAVTERLGSGAEVRCDHDLFDGVGAALPPRPAPAAHRDSGRLRALRRHPLVRGARSAATRLITALQVLPFEPDDRRGHAALPGPPHRPRGRRVHRPGARQDHPRAAGAARWPTAARSRSSPTTAPSTPRRCS